MHISATETHSGHFIMVRQLVYLSMKVYMVWPCGQQELSCCFSFQFTTAKENKAIAKEERTHVAGRMRKR